MSTIHDFSAKAITGEEVSLGDYRGKVLLIVLVALLTAVLAGAPSPAFAQGGWWPWAGPSEPSRPPPVPKEPVGVREVGPDPRKIEPQGIITAEEYQPFPQAFYGQGLHAVVSPLALDPDYVSTLPPRARQLLGYAGLPERAAELERAAAYVETNAASLESQWLVGRLDRFDGFHDVFLQLEGGRREDGTNQRQRILLLQRGPPACGRPAGTRAT
mgnify:CR=1 FL=1